MLLSSVDRLLAARIAADQPIGVILAGHNGSGKSSLWRDHLSDRLRMPLINADRMMLSILPEVEDPRDLPAWAVELRDRDAGWMRVAQQGVEAFVGHATTQRVSFAMETVFSDWHVREDGTVRSKIERIRELQSRGYFVLLCFVGLSTAELSVMRVQTRVSKGGHGIPEAKLRERFPRTQRAIRAASAVADATLFVDNSFGPEQAFTVCRMQLGPSALFDRRQEGAAEPGDPAMAGGGRPDRRPTRRLSRRLLDGAAVRVRLRGIVFVQERHGMLTAERNALITQSGPGTPARRVHAAILAAGCAGRRARRPAAGAAGAVVG